jgi:hypothetical protein
MTSSPMTSGSSSSNSREYVRSIRRIVRFAQTEADQALLEAVEAALESQFHGNFSALCKQALRHLLLPEQEGRVISPLVLQEQIVALQERVAVLERMQGRVGEPIGEPEPEPIEATLAATAKPIEAVDPLLSRLAPLLEDF